MNCPLGKTSNLSAVKVQECFTVTSSCQAGDYGVQHECEPCPSGTISHNYTVKIQECAVCPNGQTNNTDSTECLSIAFFGKKVTAGTRTLVARVTGGNTNHYTNHWTAIKTNIPAICTTQQIQWIKWLLLLPCCLFLMTCSHIVMRVLC
jgi:hypothetical protein